MVYWYGLRRLRASNKCLSVVPLGMVNRTRMGFLGGSHLMLRGLFLNLLLVRVMGLLPYFPNMSIQVCFAFVMGIPF